MLRINLTLSHFWRIIVLKIRISNFISGEFMKAVGVIKEIDRLGRIVIPKELRERYGLDAKVELVATREGVLLQSPQYVLTERKAPACTKKE